MFVDTHFHINMIEEDINIQKSVIDDSIAKGLVDGICIYTSPTSFMKDVDVVKYVSSKGIKVACGWYPEHSPSEEKINQLEDVIRSYDVFAIGEIGLEYYRMPVPKQEQIEMFELQMELARKYSKPVLIHSRDAFEDTLMVLKKYDSVKGIMHCFSGTPEMAKKYVDIGYYISFAGNLTFKKATNLQESLKQVPLDRVLFETDAPFLAPTPFRGQKNYPYMVKYVYEFASGILKIPFDGLVEKVLNNWKEFQSQVTNSRN
ncbi:MAG: TatD family hydrolase [Spirochaetia bacterium]|nr:TatD family hydrolase [Spirochaetota bacterium]MCX8096077.1 TatD family hydrolase [Spirochaetota bacterium]MDW8112195.1 TatD family hydrolase [Spirochaetia bacterium]